MTGGVGRYLFLAVVAATQVQPSQPPAGLSSQDVAVIAEVSNLWSTNAESIWPGASKIRIPILYIKADAEYAIAFPKDLPGFRSIQAPEGFLGVVQVGSRTLATDLSASFPIEGVPAVVIGSPQLINKGVEEWVITAAHEMFHVFQAASGSYAKIAALGIGSQTDASWQLTYPFPYTNADVMRLIHLQGYNLWLAATTNDVENAKYDVGTALEAADVYRAFLETLNAKGKDYLYSEFQEWNEGVAAYTEYRFAEAAAKPGYTPTAIFKALPTYRGYDQLWKDVYVNRPFLIKHAGRAAHSRSAFYHLGMGKALALDRVDPNWKSRYFAPGVWLDDLLRASLKE
jgi:hypothetical protein